jgi:hypothetical protein
MGARGMNPQRRDFSDPPGQLEHQRPVAEGCDSHVHPLI